MPEVYQRLLAGTIIVTPVVVFTVSFTLAVLLRRTRYPRGARPGGARGPQATRS
jgi:hypothetical protein